MNSSPRRLRDTGFAGAPPLHAPKLDDALRDN
jgi:hypothetical protein